MNTKRHTYSLRAVIVTAIASLSLILAPFATAQATPPQRIASVGDSISARPLASQNWATGTSNDVNSILSRIETSTDTNVTGIRKAQKGADSSKLVSQMKATIATNPDLITVLMGGNDVCGPSNAHMTSTETFRARYDEALRLADAAGVDVVAVSIPDIYGLWQAGKESARARAVWNYYDICPNVLSNPLSTTQEDTNRRLAAKQQTEAYNQIIREVCARSARCADDGGAVNGLTPRLDNLTIDYFHPNLKGQAEIAEAVWPAIVSLYPSLPLEPGPSSNTRTVTFRLPQRVSLEARRIVVHINGKSMSADIISLGSGRYQATIVTEGAFTSGLRTAKVQIFDADGARIYSGPLLVNIKAS